VLVTNHIAVYILERTILYRTDILQVWSSCELCWQLKSSLFPSHSFYLNFCQYFYTNNRKDAINFCLLLPPTITFCWIYTSFKHKCSLLYQSSIRQLNFDLFNQTFTQLIDVILKYFNFIDILMNIRRSLHHFFVIINTILYLLIELIRKIFFKNVLISFSIETMNLFN